MTREFWSEFPAVIRELDQNGESRVLVISSTGAHFSSGMDLSVFESGTIRTKNAQDRDQIRRLIAVLQSTFSCLETGRMPVIAAVHGGCIGGAFDLVCACDIRLATQDSFFKIQEINLAMMADLGVLQRLQYLLPDSVVRELAFTGEPLQAERALSLGFVNNLFDTHDAMIDAAMALAKKISQQSPLAIAASKESLNFARDHSLIDSLNHCANLQAAIFHTDELLECMKAKSEKRPPSFANMHALKSSL